MDVTANRARWPELAEFVDLCRSVFVDLSVRVMQITDRSGTYTASGLVNDLQHIDIQQEIHSLYDLHAFGVRAASRRLEVLRGAWAQGVAVPVTPPLCPMGGTFTPKTGVTRC